MTDKEQAMMICLFIYNEFYNPIHMNGDTTQDIPSRPVSKLLRQINHERLKLIRSNPELYETLRLKINKSKTETIEELVRPLKAKYIATKEDILVVFWNSLNRNPHQEIWVTERTVIKAINSLSNAKNSITADENEAMNNGRKIVRMFLDKLGVKDTSGLRTRKNIIRENLICEGKEVVI